MASTASNGRTQTSLSDINITPLVDVVLVLLIIFMVTAPVLQSGIEVSVPKTRTVKEITEERRQAAAEDPRSAAPVGLHPRGRERALRRLRHSDGCGEAIGDHECEHRDATARKSWKPTLRYFSNTTGGAAIWPGRWRCMSR